MEFIMKIALLKERLLEYDLKLRPDLKKISEIFIPTTPNGNLSILNGKSGSGKGVVMKNTAK
jgi:hypothetical protein